MWALITAVTFAIAIFTLELIRRSDEEHSKKGRRTQFLLLVVGLASTIIANWIQYHERDKKVAIVDVLDDVDLHLGDNVYPNRYGYSHNPLHADIYKQGVRGIIYFDKENQTFLSDDDRPTMVGQALVDFHYNLYGTNDFSCYKWVKAYQPDDPEYNGLVKTVDTNPCRVLVGSTLLTSEQDACADNFFYERYAAIGIAKSLNFLSACEKEGIDLSNPNKIRTTVLITCYHGGIREGQSENFELVFNDFRTTIPSKTRRMRDPQEVSIKIPSQYVYLDRENTFFLYVLPWLEKGPVKVENGITKEPRHFRDVGIIHLAIKLEEK